MDTPYHPNPDIRGQFISLLLQSWYAEAGELDHQADHISFPGAAVAMGDLLAVFVDWVERTGRANDQADAVSELARMMVRYAKETGESRGVSFLEFLQDKAAGRAPTSRAVKARQRLSWRRQPAFSGYSLAARIASASASRRRASSAVTRADRSGSARTWRISSRITSAAATSRAWA